MRRRSIVRCPQARRRKNPRLWAVWKVRVFAAGYSSLEFDHVLEFFQGIINDRAVRSPVHHLPHPAFERSRAPDQMREVAARVGPALRRSCSRFPPEKTHPDSRRRRIGSFCSNADVVVYCSTNSRGDRPKWRERRATSRTVTSVSATRQQLAQVRQSMADSITSATRRNFSSGKLCRFRWRRNFSFSTCFFSPSCLI